jgi:hypothetical protein
MKIVTRLYYLVKNRENCKPVKKVDILVTRRPGKTET